MFNRKDLIYILCYSIILLLGCNKQKDVLHETSALLVENKMKEVAQKEENLKEYATDKKEVLEKIGIDLEKLLTEDIILKYGEIGKYGKEEIYDGEKYISYYIPAGEYTVTNMSYKLSCVFIESNGMYKNNDGYWDNDIIKSIYLKKMNESQIFVIGEDMHISLSMNSHVKFSNTGKIIE